MFFHLFDDIIPLIKDKNVVMMAIHFLISGVNKVNGDVLKFNQVLKQVNDAVNLFNHDVINVIAYEILVISYENLVISYENVVVSYENLVISYENVVISYENIVTSYGNLVVSYENIVTSYENLVISYENIVTSYENVVRRVDILGNNDIYG
jgi:hypothetical protein